MLRRVVPGVDRIHVGKLDDDNTLRLPMTALRQFVIAEHIVTDEAKFHEFRTKVELMMAKHGGRYLTKGSAHDPLCCVLPAAVVGAFLNGIHRPRRPT